MELFRKLSKSMSRSSSDNIFDNKKFEEELLKNKNKLDENIFSFLMEIFKKSKMEVVDLEKKSDKWLSMLKKEKNPESLSNATEIINHSKEYSNKEIVAKILEISEYLPFYRKIRGDGNCFYRAVGFGFLEDLFYILIEGIDKKMFSYQLIDFLKEISENKSELIEMQLSEGYNKNYFKNLKKILKYKEILKHIFLRICSKLILSAFECHNFSEFYPLFEETFIKNPLFDISVVFVFRDLIYNALLKNIKKEEYAPFIINPEEFLSKLMIFGEEAENILIPITSDALKRVIIVNMVHTSFDGKTIVLKEVYSPLLFDIEMEEKKNDHINLYFRPGHYDLAYEKKSKFIKYFKN